MNLVRPRRCRASDGTRVDRRASDRGNAFHLCLVGAVDSAETRMRLLAGDSAAHCPDGKSTKLFSSKDLTVQAVRVAKDGSVFAATLPSGKVYKLPAGAVDLDESKAEVVFDPAQTEEKPKYIWDLAFDGEGRLYIATGGPAAVYRLNIASSGAKPAPFFKSDEQHIRALAFDKAGNLIVGSDERTHLSRRCHWQRVHHLRRSQARLLLAIADNGTIYLPSAAGRLRCHLYQFRASHQ